MKKITAVFLLVLFTKINLAQTYLQQIQKHRENYKQEFLKDDNSPLKKDDLQFLDFYPIDKKYKVSANFKKINDNVGFTMQTHSGKEKHYFVYGKLSFVLLGKKYVLNIYQSESLLKNDEYKDYLFVPFTDKTNSITTFGGGRYLDFRFSDIKNNRLEIDFNKCYNPYCAFAGGYSCPIPPKENDMKIIKVEAGEKLFLKAVAE